MSKLYLTYNGKNNTREYYSYDVLKTGPVYITLKEQEIVGYLRRLLASSLKKVREVNNNLVEVETSNGDILIVDDIRVFSKSCDLHDKAIHRLRDLINVYMEEKNIEEYKRKHPDYKKKKVKRNPRPNRMAVGGIAITIVILMVANSALSKQKKQHEEIEIEMPQEEMEAPQVEEKIAYEIVEEPVPIVVQEVKNESVEVAFDDWTDSGKLEKTIEDCSRYMDFWIDRYGLPRDLTYAIPTFESGALEFIEQENGACGPMQLQLRAQHGEHYKIEVLKDGVPTGEYDEFWAADARRLDDPALKGKPIKIIQDPEDHFQIGCAYYRNGINRYYNPFIATDSFNKGLYALTKTYEVCGNKIEKSLEYYKENLNDFSWVSIIPDNCKEVFGKEKYGDPNYIWNVLKYLKTDTRGQTNIEYYYKGKTISVDISNANVYNNDYQRSI